jgi:hypothetical protein
MSDAWQDLIDRLLPPGYRVLNDGPGREVLSHESWEHGVVYGTVSDAIDAARADAERAPRLVANPAFLRRFTKRRLRKMFYSQTVIEMAKKHGVDFSTARVDPDGVWRCEICAPLTTGYMEDSGNGWTYMAGKRPSFPVQPVIVPDEGLLVACID